MAGERTSTRKSAEDPSERRSAEPAKRPTKKSAGKPAARSSASTSRNGRSREDGPAASRPRSGATKIAASAAQQLLELTGRQAEGVTGLERSDDGWTVQVEVVEVRRIPETTDVLALYEVQTDERGELLGYRRLRRYARGDATEE